MATSQGNRAGRSCVVELKYAALSSEFGMKMLREKFAEDADAILAVLGTYTRGPRKGLPRGYVHWEKVVEGGWSYREARVRVPGTAMWRVLDTAVAFDTAVDVSYKVAEARLQPIREAEALAANQAREARKAERDALQSKIKSMIERGNLSGKRGQCVSDALIARLAAHFALRRGDVVGFHENIQIALGQMTRAKHVNP
ncbi:hypothetical protein CPT_Sonora_086 [Stenotrophomonas phage Sonora]|nr:hypothetical protein CPT_Sonora_086 [Stenotrophomonas phage Sonora]